MTENELRKLVMESYDNGVKAGFDLVFQCLKKVELELSKMVEKLPLDS